MLSALVGFIVWLVLFALVVAFVSLVAARPEPDESMPVTEWCERMKDVQKGGER